jgi:uncharacterized membrane protein YhdT
MITALIFAFHLMFITVIFTKKWQTESLSSGLSNVALIIILFSVGWSLTGMLAKVLMEKEGFGLYFDRDTFSLALLTVIEFIFYRFYYNEKESTATEADKEI